MHASSSGATRLTQEQLQKSLERLTQSKRSEVCLPPIIKDKYITSEQLQRSIERLYNESIEARQSSRDRRMHSVSEAVAKDVSLTTKPISASDEDDMVQRLHNEALKEREHRMQELRSKETRRYSHLTVKLKATDLSESVNRLYTDSMSQRHEERVRLFKKYVLNRRSEPVQRRLSTIMSIAEKMSHGETALS